MNGEDEFCATPEALEAAEKAMEEDPPPESAGKLGPEADAETKRRGLK